MLGNTYKIKRPEKVPESFWNESMNQLVGRTCTVTKVGNSNWVNIDIDEGFYLWHKNWLEPVNEKKAWKNRSKLKVRTLKDELAVIDAKADEDIKRIKREGFIRRRKMAEKAEIKKRWLSRDNTSKFLNRFLRRNKKVRDAENSKKPGWSLTTKLVAASMATSALGSLAYSLVSILG